MLETIIKRNGDRVAFDPKKIEMAVRRCFQAVGTDTSITPENATERVIACLEGDSATVEQVQDVVERILQENGAYEQAKAYILYRHGRATEREIRPIPDTVRQAFAQSDPYFPTQLQKFQFYDKYSRFNYQLGRRETWVETVDRAVSYLRELSHGKLEDEVYERLREGILTMKVMPSMRLLAMAGDAARRNNVAIYNCSYMAVDRIHAFVDAMSISMAGCGVGYSVERQYVDKLPVIALQSNSAESSTMVIEDSSEGWVDALRRGLDSWFNGRDVRFDYSQIRPAGSPLRIKGGRASGHQPLKKILDYARYLILANQGRRIRPIHAHDLMCVIAGAVVSGGVRRSAMISLFDMDDQEMLHCKDGDNLIGNEHRWNANNSAVWTREYSQAEIADLMMTMFNSGRGEPGIYSRKAAKETIPARRESAEFGVNPCGEILLRSKGFCNLTSAICRASDGMDELHEKVELATIIGTIQSMATYFPMLDDKWRGNCEEERLLGVDLNGQMDSDFVQHPAVLKQLREHAVKTNARYARILGINQSVAVTCVKPSGNSSTLVNSSSGIHARWSPYYIRNVRISAHSPLLKVMKSAGVPMDPENGQTIEDADTWVVHFPIKTPDGAVTRNDRTAIEQCDYWLLNKEYYTEHNPSVTITYRPNEVIDLIKWVWENQDKIGGMAFLPAFDAQYDQMPYEEIGKDEYERLSAEFPNIDFSEIYKYEKDDLTKAAQELACMAGNCDL